MNHEQSTGETQKVDNVPRHGCGTGVFVTLDSAVWHLVTASVLVSCLSITGILIIGALDTVGRAFFNMPFLGAIEISEALLAVAIFTSLSYAQRSAGHVVVDIFSNNYGPRLKAVANVIYLAATLAVLVFLAWRTGITAEAGWRHNDVSPGYIPVPIWLAKIVAFLGLIVACVECMRQFVRALAGLPPSGRGTARDDGQAKRNHTDGM